MKQRMRPEGTNLRLGEIGFFFLFRHRPGTHSLDSWGTDRDISQRCYGTRHLTLQSDALLYVQQSSVSARFLAVLSLARATTAYVWPWFALCPSLLRRKRSAYGVSGSPPLVALQAANSSPTSRWPRSKPNPHLRRRPAPWTQPTISEGPSVLAHARTGSAGTVNELWAMPRHLPAQSENSRFAGSGHHLSLSRWRVKSKGRFACYFSVCCKGDSMLRD